MSVLSAAAIAFIWLFSLQISYRRGELKGWEQGHEDTKKATYEILNRKMR